MRQTANIYAVIPSIRKDVVGNTVSNILSGELIPKKVVVVDNGANIPLEDSGHIKVIRLRENLGSEGGYYAGIKYAVAKSECEYIFTSDDDTEYEADALKELFFWLNNLPEAGAVRCAWKEYKGGVKEVRYS